jgi:hypothetical protein
MSTLEQQLLRFQQAILQGKASNALADIKPNPRLSPEQQMNIYIEGYRLRLLAALASDYPALLALLGKQAFDKAALAYIESTPSVSYNLDVYPHAFAAHFAKARPEDFASELAQLESALATVFMAEESTPLTADALATLSPEALGETVLRLRTASRLLAFCNPVSQWLDAQRQSQNTPPPQAACNEYVLVYRHENSVRREPLSAAAYWLLKALHEGMSVAGAIEQVAAQHPDHAEELASHLQGWFCEWTQKGVFRA